MTFYDKFSQICKSAKVSPTKAAKDIGLSNSLVTKWKKTGAMPRMKNLLAIADYFDFDRGSFLRMLMIEIYGLE